MKNVYIDKIFTENQKKYLSEVITKYHGAISNDSNNSDLLILYQIDESLRKKFIEIDNAKASLIVSFNCIREMDHNEINPFEYKSENKLLQNIYLRQKSFCFSDIPYEKIQFYSSVIKQLDGKIVDKDSDFILTEKSIQNSPSNCVYVDWICALQYLLNPSEYLLNKKVKQNRLPIPIVEKKDAKKQLFTIPILKKDSKNKKSDNNQFSLSKQFMNKSDNCSNSNFNNSPQNFQYTDKFIQAAYEMKVQYKYSYAKLKSEMEIEYPDLRSESDDRFKDACKYCFSHIKAKQNMFFGTDNYSNFLHLIDNLKGYLKSDYYQNMNKVQLGNIQRIGPWSESEERHLKFILIEGSFNSQIFSVTSKTKESINWVKVARYIPERTGKSIYDKYKRMIKSGDFQKIEKRRIQKTNGNKIFNLLIHRALNNQQENELLSKILSMINGGQEITVADVSTIARQIFYSPLSLATKAAVFSYLNNKEWPFDTDGDINIPNFEEIVGSLLEMATSDPDELMRRYGIRHFNASLPWVYKYLKRHFLTFKEAHYERRGAIKNSEVQRFLEELADAIAEYGENLVLNMDETCIRTFNPRRKQIAQKGKDTIKLSKDKLNEKEGTTYIAILPMNPQIKMPFVIVASGRSELCEEKFKIENNNDYCLHSTTGWTNEAVMIKYLRWLSQQMNGQKFALILDVFRAHKKQAVLEEAAKLNIKLIFVPSCGTGVYQPLDRKIFGIVKAKLRKESCNVKSDENRFRKIHSLMCTIWEEISDKAINSAWDIPDLGKFLILDQDSDDEDYIPEEY